MVQALISISSSLAAGSCCRESTCDVKHHDEDEYTGVFRMIKCFEVCLKFLKQRSREAASQSAEGIIGVLREHHICLQS